MQPVLKGVPESKPAPRPDGLLVDNGEFYFSEFPPGQAVASLDLSSGDALTDFNNNRSTGGVDNTVRPLSTPARRCPARVSPARDRPPPDSPRSPSRTRRSRKARRPRRRWPSRCPCRRPALCRAGRRASPRPGSRWRRPRLPAHPRAARAAPGLARRPLSCLYEAVLKRNQAGSWPASSSADSGSVTMARGQAAAIPGPGR